MTNNNNKGKERQVNSTTNNIRRQRDYQWEETTKEDIQIIKRIAEDLQP